MEHGQPSARLLEILEENAMKILKKELKESADKLPARRATLAHLTQEYDTFDSDSAELKLRVLKEESDVALQHLRRTYNELTEDHLREIAAIHNPPYVLVEVATAYAKLIFLGHDFDWQEFQEHALGWDTLKEAMHNYSPEPSLTENILTRVIPIWQDRAEREIKLKRVCPPAVRLLDFIYWSVQYKLKKERYNDLRNDMPHTSDRKQDLREQLEEARV